MCFDYTTAYSLVLVKFWMVKAHASSHPLLKPGRTGTEPGADQYMISGHLYDFLGLCAFRTHVVSDFWVYTFRFLNMYFPIFDYALKYYKIISDHIISYLYLYNQ